ncbi:MAG: AMP-binding protein, partial [Chlorobiales bacterium]|nr:AMP-binding protein [Chlorobiales bacterium]
MFRDKNGTLLTVTPVLESVAETNPVRTENDFHRMRAACEKDPGSFHGSIAKREIHWYDEKLKAWITYSDNEHRWIGLDGKTGKSVDIPYPEDHNPWKVSFDDSKAPLYRWFSGGLTNTCFNEVDRHVMMGYGDEIAYHFEGDRWDATKNDGKGGPVTTISVTRKKLLFEVVKCALALKKLGVKKGDRVCLNMPNILDQIYYTEACKRMGVIYTAVFGGFSDKTLSDRIHNADAKVVITSDGAYRNAQVVPFKEEYTDKALDNYIPYEVAVDLVGKRLNMIKVSRKVEETILSKIRQTLSEEITLERSDIMRSVGQALSELSSLSIKEKSLIRTEIARSLVETPQRVKNVIVVRHTGQDVNWHTERDKWSHDLLHHAEKQLFTNAINAGLTVKTEKELLAL